MSSIPFNAFWRHQEWQSSEGAGITKQRKEQQQYPFNGLYSISAWVCWHHKGKLTILDVREVRVDEWSGSDISCTTSKSLHHGPERQLTPAPQHRFVTNWMFFLVLVQTMSKYRYWSREMIEQLHILWIEQIMHFLVLNDTI